MGEKLWSPQDQFCRAQIGLFHSLADEMANQEIKFASYDTSSTSCETLQKLGVTGTPCYKLFQGHSEIPLHYNGEINSSGMEAYLKNHAAMSSSQISTIDEWEALVRSSKYTVVGFLDPERAVAERNAFLEVLSFSGKTYSMGVVDAAPRKWLGSEAIPSWLGIDCTLDDASWAIVAYHTR